MRLEIEGAGTLITANDMWMTLIEQEILNIRPNTYAK
jgi:hypothetical protein